MRRFLVLLIFAMLPALLHAGEARALLVSGLPGSDLFAERQQDWLGRFQSYLKKQGVKDITVLNGAKKESTLKALDQQLQKLAERIKADDQFILIVLGHGSLVDTKSKLILPGPDLTPELLAARLSAITAANQVVLNLSGAGGDFLMQTAAVGRVNITANAPSETSDPIYAEFFLRALESGRADGSGGKKDGKITLLEAYSWAAYQTAQFVARQKGKIQMDGSFEWEVVGKDTVKTFKKLYDGKAGRTGARILAASSQPGVDDPIVKFGTPPPGATKKADFNKDYWNWRRVPMEHALLEDTGEETGVYGIHPTEDGKGFVAMTAETPEDPGFLAGRVILGKTELLAAPNKK